MAKSKSRMTRAAGSGGSKEPMALIAQVYRAMVADLAVYHARAGVDVDDHETAPIAWRLHRVVYGFEGSQAPQRRKKLAAANALLAHLPGVPAGFEWNEAQLRALETLMHDAHFKSLAPYPGMKKGEIGIAAW